MLNVRNQLACIPAHDLSFATSFIIAVLFLMVKASRPMTYQYLTVSMFKAAYGYEIIDQTMFKTQQKYGFDSLIFSVEVLKLLNAYIDVIRPRLHSVCKYVLICRNGKQLSKLSDIYGRIVYQVIGKYINPTRYRQIIETESAENLPFNDKMALTEDQNHTSQVAKVHYQKMKSRVTARKGNECTNKLRNKQGATASINDINSVSGNIEANEVHFEKTNVTLLEMLSDDDKNTSKNLKISKKSAHTRNKKINFYPLEDISSKMVYKSTGMENGLLLY